jgi:hypothetical protein
MEEGQQQRQQPLHSGVLDAIERLADPYYRTKRHALVVRGVDVSSDINYGRLLPPMDRQSLQYLVDFLLDHNNNKNARCLGGGGGGGDDSCRQEVEIVIISELKLDTIRLQFEPSDGGTLQVLRDFFARSDSTLTKSQE